VREPLLDVGHLILDEASDGPGVAVFSMNDFPAKPLLILDLDETLIHAAEARLDRSADFRVGPYHVYRRPTVGEFLSRCSELYRMAIWSSASSDYVEQIAERIIPDGFAMEFIWSRPQCSRQYDAERQEEYFLKDLKRVRKLGFDLEQVLIVDDEARKLRRQYGNAIYVRPFTGAIDDDELPLLADYLVTISAERRFRNLEKRGWRHFKSQ